MSTMKDAMTKALSTAPPPVTGKAKPTVHGAQKAHLEFIPVEDIDVVPQVRTAFDQAKLKELAASIAANGVLQPLVVRVVAGRYQLVAGERRLRASKLAALGVVPAWSGTWATPRRSKGSSSRTRTGKT